jgi:CheY-like chemotaxis protein
MKIMVVDDHAGIRSLLCGFLTDPENQLRECGDGQQAVAEYESFQPDWIIMDSSMKGLHGLAASEQLRRRHPEARILLISDEVTPQLCRAAQQAGASGLVTKGFLLEQLSRERVAGLKRFGTTWMTGSHLSPRTGGGAGGGLSARVGHLQARVLSLLLCAGLTGLASWAPAQTLRLQQIQLKQGWNAVYLEVQPVATSPATVFGGTPIEIAAAYYAPGIKSQFMTDPSANLFRTAGWGVWYSRSRPDAFLTSLHAVNGQRAYLLYSRTDYTLSVNGAVLPQEVAWEPNAFNFVGFGVRAGAAPTFAQFFGDSPAHQHNRIYRLTDGSWRRVLDPSAEVMKSGEAFWIFCTGASKFHGPLRLETKQRDGVLLANAADGINLRNETDHPLAVTIEHLPSTNAVPLSILIQTVGDPVTPVRSVGAPLPAGPWTQPLPPLEARAVVRVPFEARAEELSGALGSSLLRITTDLGTENWMPVVAIRKDKEAK